MRIVFRVVLYLLIAGAVGLVAMAVFSDLPAPQQEVSVPVEAN